MKVHCSQGSLYTWNSFLKERGLHLGFTITPVTVLKVEQVNVYRSQQTRHHRSQQCWRHWPAKSHTSVIQFLVHCVCERQISKKMANGSSDNDVDDDGPVAHCSANGSKRLAIKIPLHYKHIWAQGWVQCLLLGIYLWAWKVEETCADLTI